jgi:hypothetical protein
MKQKIFYPVLSHSIPGIIIMKFSILLFVSFIGFTTHIHAQKISIEVSGGHNLAFPVFKRSVVEKNYSFQKDGLQPVYAISVSGKIKNLFYIKSEVGYNYNYSDLNITFKNKQGNAVDLNKDYRSTNVYLGVLAEIREYYHNPLYWYANAGVSSYSVISGVFTTQSATGNTFNPNDFNSTKIGLITNVGIGIKTKSVGFFMCNGVNYILPGKSKSELPALGYLQYNIRLGISYDID